MAQRISLDDQEAAALAGLIASPRYELIPLKKMMDAAGHLPSGAVVSVTASPAQGLDATIDAALDLKLLGFEVVPHLSARLTRDRAHLAGVLARLDAAGVTRAFVVGGDSDPQGEFFDGLALLEAMAEMDHGLVDVGVPSYPEGHPAIADETLLEALLAKQEYATHTATQMCFDARAIVDWVGRMRSAGVSLPIHIGLPGVAPLHRLAAISARIGVGQSVRYLSKQHGLVGSMLRPGGYTPDELLAGLVAGLEGPDLAGLHIFTFNQVATTEAWRVDLLASLAEPTASGES